MAIQTDMSGKEIDQTLKAFLNAEDDENKGLILYIRKGELAFDTEENLFSVATLT